MRALVPQKKAVKHNPNALKEKIKRITLNEITLRLGGDGERSIKYVITARLREDEKVNPRFFDAERVATAVGRAMFPAWDEMNDEGIPIYRAMGREKGTRSKLALVTIDPTVEGAVDGDRKRLEKRKGTTVSRFRKELELKHPEAFAELVGKEKPALKELGEKTE